MAEATERAKVAKEMVEYGIEVPGISKTRWKWMGSTTLQSGVKVVYVGDEEVRQGSCEVRTEKVELVRACTQERGGERLFCSIGVDSRRVKNGDQNRTWLF